MSDQPNDSAKEKPYHWFSGQSVQQLYDELTEYGPDKARLEVRTEGKKMLLRVTGPDGDGGGDINNSHICPPQCS